MNNINVSVIRAVMLLAVLFSWLHVNAADALADSVKPRLTLDEVVVTGQRSSASATLISQSVTAIGREVIDNSLQPSLLPMLASQVSGLFTTARATVCQAEPPEAYRCAA